MALGRPTGRCDGAGDRLRASAVVRVRLTVVVPSTGPLQKFHLFNVTLLNGSSVVALASVMRRSSLPRSDP